MNNFIIDSLSFSNYYQGLSQWLLFLLALLTFATAYNEFILKKRPFIDTEIIVLPNINGSYTQTFFAKLANKGNYPAKVSLKDTLIKIGDESYPLEMKNKKEFYLFPNSFNKPIEIGHINSTGIKK